MKRPIEINNIDSIMKRPIESNNIDSDFGVVNPSSPFQFLPLNEINENIYPQNRAR